jgi:phytanoyl-CoA hydroxylase
MTARSPGQAGQRDYVSALAERGYAVVDDVLGPAAMLDPILDAMARHLGSWARERVSREMLPRTFEAWSLEDRLIEFARRGIPGLAQALDISLPPGGIGTDTPMFLAEEVFALLSAPSLLGILQPLLGGEIWLSPVGHTRLKVPSDVAPGANGLLGHVPWHQDNGVLLADADDTDIITAWIPLVDVAETTGCLQVIPTRREHALIPHCPGRAGVAIPADQLPGGAPVPVPMRRGSVLLMHSRTVHSSMPNLAPDRVRLSLDLRYQSVPVPTGRPVFPSFPLRGQRRGIPVTDTTSWREGWLATRDRLAGQQPGKFNRWDPEAAMCA